MFVGQRRDVKDRFWWQKFQAGDGVHEASLCGPGGQSGQDRRNRGQSRIGEFRSFAAVAYMLGQQHVPRVDATTSGGSSDSGELAVPQARLEYTKTAAAPAGVTPLCCARKRQLGSERMRRLER